MYTLTYRRRFCPLARTIKAVLGHSYNAQTDKMWVLTASGGREIMKWSSCELSLGPDWKEYMAQKEREHLTKSAKAE